MRFSLSKLACLATLLAHSLDDQAQTYPPTVSLQAGAVVGVGSGAYPNALALADYNQDQRLDIAVCEKNNSQVSVWLQTTAGAFPSAVGAYPIGQSPTGLVCVALGSRQTRPRADIVALSGPGSRWTFLRNSNNGQGTFTSSTQSFGGSIPSISPQLLTAYIDTDDQPDFVYTYDAGLIPNVSWVSYDGLGSFLNGSGVRTGFAASSVAIDDFNRDGLTDVVTTNAAGSEFIAVIAPSLAGGVPLWSGNYSQRIPSGGVRPVYVTTGDINRDNLPDLAVAHETSRDVTVFVNGASYQFVSPVVYPLSAAPRQVLLSDLNRDNYPEMVVLTADDKLQIFQHTQASGAGRYTTPISIPTGISPVAMQVADIDGDFANDIVVACAGDNTVRIYLNKTFVQPTAVKGRRLANISAYPNPATTQIHLILAPGTIKPEKVELIDALGRCVHHQAMTTESAVLNTAALPRGIYVLRLTDAKGASSQRVILE